MLGMLVFKPTENRFDVVTDLLPSEPAVCKYSALVAMVKVSRCCIPWKISFSIFGNRNVLERSSAELRRAADHNTHL